MSDWQAIKQEYEAGDSLRVLAARYTIGKSTIAERKLKEQWKEPAKPRTPDTGHRTPDRTPPPLSLPADAHSIARIGLHQLAGHLQATEPLSISSHKSLSDALAQYVKVLASPMEEQDAPEGLVIPLDRLSARTRMEIRRLLAEEEALHKSQEVS